MVCVWIRRSLYPFDVSLKLKILTGAILVATFARCGGGAMTPTGFVGSWKRADGASSSISLSRASESYHMRWTRRDGPIWVRCDEPDLCFAYVSGEKVYEYRFRVYERDGSPDLFVECIGTPLQPDSPPVHYVDRLELQGGELELWSFTIERDGDPLSQPEGPIRFVKSANDPF